MTVFFFPGTPCVIPDGFETSDGEGKDSKYFWLSPEGDQGNIQIVHKLCPLKGGAKLASIESEAELQWLISNCKDNIIVLY